MSVIEVSNLTKKYKKAENNAVDNISFNVEEGEFFAFLGPNGAGKTTTISILTTTLAKTSGTLKIAGYDIDLEPKEVRSRIGVIFQNPSLDLNLTAEENIRLHTIMYNQYSFKPTYNIMPKSYKNKVGELAEIIGLGNEIFKPIRTFSGGMKRKLEIIRTLMHKPKILFLDEPTSGLDPLSRKNLWEYLNDIKKKENTTIFLTTHYLDEAETADKVCIINHGKIMINDTISKIKNKLIKDHMYVETENKEDLNKLKIELLKDNYKFEEKDNGIIIIIKNAHSQELIKNIKTKLTRININQPSLEEAYLNLLDINNKVNMEEIK
jgi:ABC-2 type transport system ATP-binding protein